MAKCYIITCAVCDLLTQVTRTDALTCGSRCRVWLHRHPDHVKPLVRAAKVVDVPVFLVLEAAAIERLRPDLGEPLRAGTLKIEDVRHDINIAFWELVDRAMAMKNLSACVMNPQADDKAETKSRDPRGVGEIRLSAGFQGH